MADRHKQEVERLQEQQRGLAEDRARFDRAAQGPPDDAKRAFIESRKKSGHEPERPPAPEPER